MKTVKLMLATIIMAATVLSSCKKDHDDIIPKGGNPGTPSSMIKTNLVGVVVDENNQPVAGASITAYGSSSATDSKGVFVMNNVSVAAERCYVKVNKAGYFPASRAVIPVKNGITQMRVMMLNNTPQFNINSSSGGSAALANGCKVDLPANGVVDANGNPYNGTVRVAVKHLDPSSDNFGLVMPGDLQATRTNGSAAVLTSYGMLGVELTGTSGQKLNMASGKQATLTLVVPSSMVSSAPSSIPLWHFDETAGIWKEEGQATLNGNEYVGTVSHFSFWNCDMPYPPATLKGKVVDCNGNPLAGIYVEGQLSSGRTGYAITDANGEFSEVASSSLLITLTISANQNFGISVTPITVGPLTAGQIYTAPTIVAPCPATLSGTIIDCNNNPVAGAVYVSWSGGSNMVSTNNGDFTIPVAAGQSATLYAYSTTGAASNGVAVTTPAAGITSAVGQIPACAVNMINSFYITGGSYNNQLVVLNPTPQGWSGAYYYTSNNTTSASVDDATTTNGIYMNFTGNSTGTFNITNTGNDYFQISYPGIDSSSTNITLDVQQYGNVGGVVAGTFSGTMQNTTTSTTYTITSGQFSVVRKQ